MRTVLPMPDVNIYSTNEQPIGRWHDGRTLYRKVVNITGNISSGSTVYTFPANVSLIRIYGTMYRTNGFVITLPYVVTSTLDYVVNLYYNNSSRGLVLERGNNIIPSITRIILEYCYS